MRAAFRKTNTPFYALVLFICVLNISAKSQDSTKQNPIVFGEVFIGHAVGKGGGFSLGTEGNFQSGKSLFTIQLISTLKISTSFAFFIFPVFAEESSQQTISLMYGRRFSNQGMSSSFSLGASYNVFQQADAGAANGYMKTYSAGIPFEANIKWFKAEKKRFRIIYGLVPVGSPTGFGRSIGFKMFGNISKTTFAGIGLSMGLGFHKKY